ncbi:copper resistance protein CopZ [Pseudomonas rhizosphaerae]|uniref:Copper resistance protein CopZ n=1 Tax=Pseudomonas rhizosphaerae TaxID=216142 RepID=A0A089YX84_9PSED|nr:heavy metal-associated domain-containing protein [Pseudomonas rhizosphaerae]AIS18350.1 copper resistance protein CopZ [Pseudomonas rhizosphaerae]
MQQFNVQGMTCGHCVRAVTQAISAHDPAAQVQVDLAAGKVETNSHLPPERIVQLIAEEGYSASLA